MTSTEYSTIIESLNLTQISAARFLGYDGRTSRRWIAGDPIPQHVQMLLRLMMHYRITPNKAFEIAFRKSFDRGTDQRYKA